MPTPTRLLGHGVVGLAARPCGVPRPCVAYWKGRTIYSPRSGSPYVARGTVVGVRPCGHRHLCDGARIRVLWRDGIVTYHCSADVVPDAEDRHQLTD